MNRVSLVKVFSRGIGLVRFAAPAAVLIFCTPPTWADHKCTQEIHVTSVEELNSAVANGEPCLIIEPGIYHLTEQLLLKDIHLQGSLDGEVIFNVADLHVENIPDIPYHDCEGGNIGIPLYPKTPLVVEGRTTIENIHFVGLFPPVFGENGQLEHAGLDGYIANTNQPCANGHDKHKITIRQCLFEADPNLFTGFDVALGNSFACGSCDAIWEIVLEENTFKDSLFGVFITNEVSDKGAVIKLAMRNNSFGGWLNGFIVIGNAAGKDGIVTGESVGNTFRDALWGAVFIGGIDYNFGMGGSDGKVLWESSMDRFENNTIGFTVIGGRVHNDLTDDPPLLIEPSTGNLVRISFTKPEFQGNSLRDGEFFASSTEELGNPPADPEDPIGRPANQDEEGLLGPGNRVELLGFEDPDFSDSVGRVIFRHHNNNFCLFEVSIFDPDGINACPNVDLAHPPHVPDFGNRVHIQGSRKHFLEELPELEEEPSDDFFDKR